MRKDEISRTAGMKIWWFEIAYGGKFQNDRQNKVSRLLSYLCSNGNTNLVPEASAQNEHADACQCFEGST
jgi:hypothetical protein